VNEGNREDSPGAPPSRRSARRPPPLITDLASTSLAVSVLQNGTLVATYNG